MFRKRLGHVLIFLRTIPDISWKLPGRVPEMFWIFLETSLTFRGDGVDISWTIPVSEVLAKATLLNMIYG